MLLLAPGIIEEGLHVASQTFGRNIDLALEEVTFGTADDGLQRVDVPVFRWSGKIEEGRPYSSGNTLRVGMERNNVPAGSSVVEGRRKSSGEGGNKSLLFGQRQVLKRKTRRGDNLRRLLGLVGYIGGSRSGWRYFRRRWKKVGKFTGEATLRLSDGVGVKLHFTLVSAGLRYATGTGARGSPSTPSA